MIGNAKLISNQCYVKIETTQLIFYTNSLIALYMNMMLVSNFLRNCLQSTFYYFISGSEIVFRVDVSMKLCILKCVMDG